MSRTEKRRQRARTAKPHTAIAGLAMRRNLSRVNCSVTLRYRLARLIASRTHLTPRVKRDRSPDEIQYHTIRPSPSSSLPPTAPSVPGTLIAGVQLCAYWRINGSENGRLAVETDGSVVTRVQCFPISRTHHMVPACDRSCAFVSEACREQSKADQYLPIA